MLRSLLAWAVTHDQRDRVALLAEHGVDIVSPFTEERSPRGARRSRSRSSTATASWPASSSRSAPGRPGSAPPTPSSRPSWPATPTPSRDTPPTSSPPCGGSGPGWSPGPRPRARPNAVELLVSAGFDVNAPGRSDVPGNEPWHTALHVAAENGDLALARTLLELGADPDIPDKHYQSTPLGWARYFDQPALVELLEPVTSDRQEEDR